MTTMSLYGTVMPFGTAERRLNQILSFPGCLEYLVRGVLVHQQLFLSILYVTYPFDEFMKFKGYPSVVIDD